MKITFASLAPLRLNLISPHLQPHRKLRPFARLTRHFNTPAARLDNGFANRESQRELVHPRKKSGIFAKTCNAPPAKSTEDAGMKCAQRAFPPRHNHRTNTVKTITILALCLAAGLKLLPSAHAQTRIYDFPLGGTCYELSVVTNSHGSTHTTLVPYPFCPIDPSFTPLYSVDDAGICIFADPDATWSQLQAACDEILYWQSQIGLYGREDDGGTGSYTDTDFYLQLVIWLTNYVGDMLITQGGRHVGEPAFYIVHWNGSDFTPRGIPVSRYSDNQFTDLGEIEGAVFAPTNLPSH